MGIVHETDRALELPVLEFSEPGLISGKPPNRGLKIGGIRLALGENEGRL